MSDMSVFEMAVKDATILLAPVFQVTVASVNPFTLHESFTVRPGSKNLSRAVEAAMEQLRPKGYRLTEAPEWHDNYATVALEKDEGSGNPHQVSPVEWAQVVLSGARAVVRRIDRIGDPDAAGEVRDLLDRVVTACQELRGHVAHLDAHDDPAGPDYEGVMARVHGDEDPHTAALAAVHEAIELRKHGGEV